MGQRGRHGRGIAAHGYGKLVERLRDFILRKEKTCGSPGHVGSHGIDGDGFENCLLLLALGAGVVVGQGEIEPVGGVSALSSVAR